MVFLHVSASTSHHSIFVPFSFPPALAITVNFFKKNSKSNADIKNTHILVFIHTTAYCFGNFVLNCRKKFSQITFLLINQSKKTKSEKHLCIHFDLEIFSHINNKKTNHKYPPHLWGQSHRETLIVTAHKSSHKIANTAVRKLSQGKYMTLEKSQGRSVRY